MVLQSAFELELSSDPDATLRRIRAMIVQQLIAATKTHRHPWHLGSVASCEGKRPRSRTVVLRAVQDEPLILRFHTDKRSMKTGQLAANPNVEWLFYEPSTRIQLRVGCSAEVVSSGDEWSHAWEKTSLASRRCYLGPFAPGSITEGASHNLPGHLLDRDPTHEESLPGAENFVIVRCAVEELEWLYLKHSGHLRCRFAKSGELWSENWIAP